VDYRKQIMQVLLYIQRHLQEDLSVEHLAETAGFSAFHFHRLFKALTGESLMAHVRRLRMEKAAWRLATSQATVIEIALESGYQTAEAFSRRFSRAFGVPPTEFRRQHGFCWHIEPQRPVHFHPQEPPRLLDVVDGSELTVELVDLPPLRVAYLEHKGPYLDSLPLWERMFEWARLQAWTPEIRAGVCYDDPAVTPAAELRYEACMSYDSGVELMPGMRVKELWHGKAAVYSHKGPYEGLEAAYERFAGGWLSQSGLLARNKPCLEFYSVSFLHEAAPEEWETLIYLPVG
jgi:AraC family transcriptional regulator